MATTEDRSPVQNVASEEGLVETQQLSQCNYLWYITAVAFWLLVSIATLVCAIVGSPNVDHWKLSAWFTERRVYNGDVPVVGILTAMAAGSFTLAIGIIQLVAVRRNANSADAVKVEAAEHVRSAVETNVLCNVKFAFGFLFIVFLEVIFADYEKGGWKNALAFLIGGIVSYSTSYAGLKAVTYAPSRVSVLAAERASSAFRLAFRASSALAWMQTGAALFWLAATFLIFEDVKFLIGFVFGKAVVALFVRLSTSNYNVSASNFAGSTATSRNAASTLANAYGSASEYSETFVTALASAALVGYFPFGTYGMAVPFYYGAISLLGDVIGSVFVRIVADDAEEKVITNRALKSFRIAVTISSAITIGLGALPAFKSYTTWRTYVAWVIGIVCAYLVRVLSEFYTSISTRFTNWVADAAEHSQHRAVIRSLGLGLATSFPVVVVLFLTTVLSIVTGDDAIDTKEAIGEYGLALAALGFTATTVLQISGAGFAAVATNANALEESKNTIALANAGHVVVSTNRGVHIGATTITAFAVVRVFLVWVLSQTYTGVDRHDFSTMVINVTTYNVTAPLNGTRAPNATFAPIVTPKRVIAPGADYIYRNAGDRAFYNMDHMLLPGYTVNLLDKRTFVGLLFGAVLPLVLVAFQVKRGLDLEKTFGAKDADAETVATVDTRASYATLRTVLFAFAVLQFVSIFFAYVTGPIMFSAVIFGAIFSGTVFAYGLGFSGSTLNTALLAARRKPSSNAGASLAVLRNLGNYFADTAVVTAALKVLALAACILIFSTLEVCNRKPVWASHCYDPRA